MIYQELVVGPLQVNCYLLGCEKSREALIIDPGGDVPTILEALAKERLTLKKIVNTHGHFDHVGGNRQLVDATGAKLYIHVSDAPFLPRVREHAALYGLDIKASPPPDRVLHGSETLQIGELSLQVIHTPGHTPGGICLYLPGHLFSGDTLFAASVGRTDLPGGDEDALIEAIRKKLFVLPDETVVHPGHGAATTIGRERRGNPYAGEGV